MQNLERVTPALMLRAELKYGGFSPLITFTLNRNLRSASSALKLHLTSSYKAWETEKKNHSEHVPEQHATNQPAHDSRLSRKTYFSQEPLRPSLTISTDYSTFQGTVQQSLGPKSCGSPSSSVRYRLPLCSCRLTATLTRLAQSKQLL